MPGAFAKTKKATNILRPAIDVSFLRWYEEFLRWPSIELKKKNRKKLFSPYKIIDSENFIKVSQNPNKVARDTQGLPTVPHNDFGGLNFKGLASNYLLLMTLPPADDEKMKKNRTSGTPTSEKTSNSASLSKVTSIAGLRMFVAFLVFATAPCKWLALYARSCYIFVFSPDIPDCPRLYIGDHGGSMGHRSHSML